MHRDIEIKICGLTTTSAVEAAISSGVNYLGFVFYPPSPRSLTPKLAAKISEGIPNDIKRVAVLVDPCDSLIEKINRHLSPDILQLHGSESFARITDIRNRFGKKIMKAIKVSSASDFRLYKNYMDVSDMLLFDSAPPTHKTNILPGGNGIAFDWKLLQSTSIEKPWFLSGGLSISNVENAVRVTGARAIDISSGIEDNTGAKSIDKIIEFMTMAKNL